MDDDGSVPPDFLASGRPASSSRSLGADLIGSSIGVYHITSLLGVGGMGEVYRARDSKLNREVALKVLPEAFAHDSNRLARFQREAKTLASLNHPNIASIHGLEQTGDVHALVMELVEGEDLSQRLVRGAIPLTETLTIARQITGALEAAHEKGIIHRDLKPANIRITPDGVVKVLDFGLAKVTAGDGSPDLKQSPTITLGGTREGVVLGTLAYMSPEQMCGGPVDKRTDIWAFGCVLYEMLTGRRAFGGEDVSATLANVLKADPDWSRLPAIMPWEIRTLLRRCLQKEAKNRYHAAADIRIVIEDAQGATETNLSTAAPTRARALVRWLQHDATLVLATLLATAAFLRYFVIVAPTGSLASHRQITFVGDATYPAISRDGQFLAYVVGPDGEQKVMVQDLVSGHTSEALKGQRFFDVRWSPDGANILAAGLGVGDDELPQELHLIPRSGGASRRLPGGARVAWSPDGSQIASVYFGASRVFLTDVETGAMQSAALTVPVMGLMQVDWSPSGEWLLLVALNEAHQESLWVVKPDGTGQQKLHEEKTGALRARWGPTGDAIYYLRGEQTQELWKLAFVSKAPWQQALPAMLLTGLEAGEFFDILGDGKRLAYTRGSSYANLWLAMFQRSSASLNVESKRLTTGTLVHSGPRISPDGTRVAYSRGDAKVTNIFVLPIDGGSPQQLTFLKSQNHGPVWSPTGKTIAFASTEGGTAKVWQVPASGGTPETFSSTRVSPDTFTLEWAPGADILYHRPGNRNFSILNPFTGAEVPLLRDEKLGWFFSPRYSPDGKEIAALWNQGDRLGVYVMTLQGPLLNDERPYRLVAGKPGFGTFGTIAQRVDVARYRGKDFKLTFQGKTAAGGGVGAQCRLREDRSRGQTGFFDNMSFRPIVSPAWAMYETAGKIDADAEQILFECFLKGAGELWLDEMQLFFKDDGDAWTPIEIANPGFEDDAIGRQPTGWRASSPEYMYQVRSEDPFKGRKSLRIYSIPVSPDAYWPIGWSTDGSSIFAIDNQKNEIVTIPARGGIATSFSRLGSQDRRLREATMTPDGQRMVYTASEIRSDVWIAENFDPSVQ
jgi:eukaryotic-like serine/threonine-protein kinase